jgi:magnesium chelatase family protein
MLARTRTFVIEGLHTRLLTVEVDIRPGLPTFTIVGLADAAIRESRDRVRAAILNSGYQFPAQRITANLAPGDVPKGGPALDLALACAVLAASGQIADDRLRGHALFGELALDGSTRPCRGTLAVAQAARQAGMQALVLAGPRAREARIVEGLRVIVAERLRSAVRILEGGAGDPLPPARASARASRARDRVPELDLADVEGQSEAVQALTIAAAGAHNLLLSGAPGTGKTMLAQRLPTILPALTRGEAIEVTRIHSITGALEVERLVTARPFRAPHHSITTAGLIGGARRGWAGEVVLAHHGVLFLDEIAEFGRGALEALRVPLEDGRVAIVRSGHATVYPARFMLVGATNPCPCGYLGEGDRCRCSAADLARYRRRLSGPLLDRIDLLVHMQRPSAGPASERPTPSSRETAARVARARERQAARLRDEHCDVNGAMDAGAVRRCVALDSNGEELLSATRRSGLLSARGTQRVLRVARTVADLEGSRRTSAAHLAVALALRPETAVVDGLAA